MKFSPEIERYRKDIVAGKKGLMPITSKEIQIVWIHPCGYGRSVVLSVDDEGKAQFILETYRHLYAENRRKEVILMI